MYFSYSWVNGVLYTGLMSPFENVSKLPAVGVIGLGVMGTPITRNLLKAAAAAGSAVHVHHRSSARVQDLLDAGAVFSETAEHLATHSDVIVLMVPDLPQVEELLTGEHGILAGIFAPTVLVIGSTSSPDGVRALHGRLSQITGGMLRVIDAPVSGGEDGAIAGTLSIMVGGDQEPVDAAWPILEAFGSPVHLGPLGSGEVAKACNQLIVAATMMALGEATVIAARSGLDVGVLLNLLGGGYAASRMLETRKQRLIDEDYSPSGVAKYMLKDLSFAASEAHRTSTTANLLGQVQRSFTELVERGYGDMDLSVTRAYVSSLNGTA